MIPKIKVYTKNYSVYITDESDYSNISGVHKFKYSDTISIDLIRYNKSQSSTYSNTLITQHDTKDAIKLPVQKDGWISIVHIILPTKQWFEKQRQLLGKGTLLTSYDSIFFSDGNKVYKYNPIDNKEPEEFSINCLVDFNLNSGNYSVYRCEVDYISISYLRKCYAELCKQIFNQRGFSPCWNKNNIDSELVFKRDLVWMAINIIQYLIDIHSEDNPTLGEIERIIENLQGCNGLCSSTNINTKLNDCGCSK